MHIKFLGEEPANELNSMKKSGASAVELTVKFEKVTTGVDDQELDRFWG